MVNSVTNTTSSPYYNPSTTGGPAQNALKALVKLLQSSQSSGAAASSQGSGTDPAQALFSQIDSTGKGSITKSDLEAAVTKGGGTKQAADALYAKLDPNNTVSVSESQFAQNLSKPPGSGAADNAAQSALMKLVQSSGTSVQNAADPTQALFDTIDATGKGSISKSDLDDEEKRRLKSMVAALSVEAELLREKISAFILDTAC